LGGRSVTCTNGKSCTIALALGESWHFRRFNEVNWHLLDAPVHVPIEDPCADV
jgi:hypothetical protein